MQSVTLYDVRQEPAPIRNEIRGGLVGTLLGALLLAVVWKRRERAPKVMAAAFLLGWAGLSAWNARELVQMHREAQAKVERGDVEVTEGIVEDLVPPPPEGGFETFRIGNRVYLVTDGERKQPGLARTSTRGGPIRKGARLRISSSGKSILRVEEIR